MIYGKTRNQRRQDHENKIQKRKSWRRWFAWYPVTLDDSGRTVWLEIVEKQERYHHHYCVGYLTYYRQINKEIS